MRFEWDKEKAEANLRKHGVDFQEAALVFSDPHRIEDYDARKDYGEDRFVTTGKALWFLLTVAYTERGDKIRIISARQATRDETEACRQG